MHGAGTGSRGAASVIVIGVDAKVMGQIREALGTEAVLPATPTAFEDALTAVRRVRPDVVLVGFDQDQDEAVRIALQLQGEFPRTMRVAVSNKNDNALIKSAMRAGFKEFILLPDDMTLLREAVHEATYGEDVDDDAGEVIAIWGAKGGIGTTLLAVNLGAELSPVHRTCVVDMDFSMGDTAAFLDLQPSQSIHDLLRSVHRLDERMLSGHVLVHPSKLHVLAQPVGLDQREEVRGDMIMKVLTAVAKSYQYCIADCGSRIDEATLTTATVADHILLVLSPDVPAVKNTIRRLALLDNIGVEKNRIKLVLNRWDRKNPALPIADIERNVGRKVEALVSEDRLALRAVNEGKLLRDLDKKAAIVRDMEGLVGLITDGEVSTETKTPASGGVISWLFGR